MNIIFASVGKWEPFRCAVKASRERSGCSVYVASTVEGTVDGEVLFGNGDFSETMLRLEKIGSKCQIRWFLTRMMIDRLHLEPPFFCPDWDVVVLHSVVEHIESMNGYDVLSTADVDTSYGAPYAISSYDILDRYCKYMGEVSTHASSAVDINDMATWICFCGDNRLKVGNLSLEYNGGLFDHNIHSGKGQFQFDGNTKKIVWVDKMPYFVLNNGRLVKALAIHCWGEYKTRIPELISKAGL